MPPILFSNYSGSLIHTLTLTATPATPYILGFTPVTSVYMSILKKHVWYYMEHPVPHGTNVIPRPLPVWVEIIPNSVKTIAPATRLMANTPAGHTPTSIIAANVSQIESSAPTLLAFVGLVSIYNLEPVVAFLQAIAPTSPTGAHIRDTNYTESRSRRDRDSRRRGQDQRYPSKDR